MQIVSFNVNGIRAIIQKSFEQDILALNADIICLQETKAQKEQVAEALKNFNNYSIYANSAERKGYSGTAILSKITPMSVKYGVDAAEHDLEGRVITLEFENFFLVNVYTPNSGSELLRLDYRQKWDHHFFSFLKKLEEQKPVIFCGDLNVAHTELDLARPKQNYNKSAGFMQEEIDGIANYLDNGFIDSFRQLFPTTQKYSWWSYRGGARQKNVGWRIDYFLLSNVLKSKLIDSEIHNDIFGSDHCPVSIKLDF